MLKPMPCPFCGVLPELRPTNPEREGNAWGAVTCVNRDCPTFPTRRHGDHGVYVDDGESVNDERGTEAYQQVAIKRWNGRRP